MVWGTLCWVKMSVPAGLRRSGGNKRPLLGAQDYPSRSLLNHDAMATGKAFSCGHVDHVDVELTLFCAGDTSLCPLFGQSQGDLDVFSYLFEFRHERIPHVHFVYGYGNETTGCVVSSAHNGIGDMISTSLLSPSSLKQSRHPYINYPTYQVRL